MSFFLLKGESSCSIRSAVLLIRWLWELSATSTGDLGRKNPQNFSVLPYHIAAPLSTTLSYDISQDNGLTLCFRIRSLDFKAPVTVFCI